jgi:dienelactone hydrolase
VTETAWPQEDRTGRAPHPQPSLTTEDAPLIIRGGGTTVVAPEALLARRDALRAASAVCSAQAVRVRGVRGTVEASLALDLEHDERALLALAEDLAWLAAAVQSVAEVAGQTERTLGSWLEGLGAHYAAAAGWLGSRLGLVVLPGLLAGAGVIAAGWRLLPEEHRDALVATALAAAPGGDRPLSEPQLVEAMRWVLTLVDDAALGAVGVPPPLVAALGESGLGLSGVSGAATAVLGLATLAGVRGTAPVRVEPVVTDLRRSGGATAGGAPATTVIAAPGSVAERVHRIPDASAPVRVERYDGPSGAHFEVYIAGTDSTAPLGGPQPWDMASNVALVADQDASSLQAVRSALAAAGATADSSVVFTGYSQGGAIATRLAESGQWATAGLVTVGSPSGDLPVLGDYPAIVIEHREDLVPGLSGVRRETEALVVQSEALRAGTASAAGVTGVLAAHDLDRYRATAERVDSSAIDELRTRVDALPGSAGGGAEGTVLRFTAARIPPP